MIYEILDEDTVSRLVISRGSNFLGLIDQEVESSVDADKGMLKIISVAPEEQKEAKILEQFKDDPWPYGAYVLSLS